MKRGGSAVFLMEFILVILFFSLSSVVTLRLFMAAHQQEQQSARLSDALEAAEDTAELYRARGAAAFEAEGWSRAQEAEGVRYTCARGELRLSVLLRREMNGAGVLETGELLVTAADRDEDLCRLPLGRYQGGDAA